jgi:hypothetical protein
MAGNRARRIPEVYQFAPDNLMAEMAKRGRLVGVVIDLTSTSKYYDPEKAFKPKGIAHIKLASKGHGEVPQPLIVNTFFWEVRKHMMMLQQRWYQVTVKLVMQLQKHSSSTYKSNKSKELDLVSEEMHGSLGYLTREAARIEH